MDPVSQPQVPTFDLSSPASVHNAGAILRQLRRDDPVYFSPQLQAWFITRYDDILSAFNDRRLVSKITNQIDRLPPEERAQLSSLHNTMAMWMGPAEEDHLRWQKLFKRHFTPRTIEGLRPRMQHILDQILEPLYPKGELELVSELAYPFPAWTIASILGVPPKDYPHFQRWSHDILNAIHCTSFERLLESQRGLEEMTSYMALVVKQHREQIHEDLIGVMVEAQDSGLIVSEAELLANCSLLLFAGHETTANLIANGMALLFDNPTQMDRLRQNLDLLPGAIEEMMRIDGPASVTPRVAVADLELGGCKIKSGQLVFLALESGNHDERKFERADTFDIARKKTEQHLGFGMGSHYCLGAGLARMEARICFATLLQRLPNLRSEAGKRRVEINVPLVHSYRSIPIAWDMG